MTDGEAMVGPTVWSGLPTWVLCFSPEDADLGSGAVGRL